MIYKDEICRDVARQKIQERKLSLSDLEQETGMKDTHEPGSKASKRKRGSIQAEFIRRVEADITILDKYPKITKEEQ